MRAATLSPAYDFVAAKAYIPDDKLALTFGGSRSLDRVTLEQIRRFSETAGLPGKPVVAVARETAEATATAWRKLPHKDLLAAGILKAIDTQIVQAAEATQQALA